MQLQTFPKYTNKTIIKKTMTEEFEIAGISTGTWWSSPTNTATVFSGYSLPCSTEISLDVTNFGWQNIENKIYNYHNDGFMNM